MLLGMPIVSFHVGGIDNFIDHRRNGYLYQAYAPYMLAYYICKVFEDLNESIRMGNNAREDAVKYFDRDRNMEKMVEIYSDIIEKR